MMTGHIICYVLVFCCFNLVMTLKQIVEKNKLSRLSLKKEIVMRRGAGVSLDKFKLPAQSCLLGGFHGNRPSCLPTSALGLWRKFVLSLKPPRSLSWPGNCPLISITHAVTNANAQSHPMIETSGDVSHFAH